LGVCWWERGGKGEGEWGRGDLEIDGGKLDGWKAKEAGGGATEFAM